MFKVRSLFILYVEFPCSELLAVIIQSLCLQKLLPFFDIPYLPHYMHLAPFRSGLLDSAGARGDPGNGTSDCLSIDPAAQDRYIDEVFLRGILRATERK